MAREMRKAWMGLAVLGAAAAVGTPLAQAQAQSQSQSQDNPTLGGHIGFVLPLVTHVGGQTINDTADQFSIGFPIGVTVKGSGRMAFDFELDPFINTARPRQTTLTVAPGLVWNVGHGWGVGMRAAFDVNNSSWGFTPLVNHSWPIRREHSFFKAWFIEGDLPVRFNRPVTAPATNAVTFAVHVGLGF
jgi:hypothetical protein